MGGTPQAPKTYSPMEQAQAQMLIDNAQWEREQGAARQDRERTEAKRAEDISRTAGDVDRLYGQGEAFGRNRASNLGYEDRYGIMNNFQQLLGGARSRVPQISENVGSYFDYDNLWNQATQQAQSAEQTRLDNKFRDMTPVGWQSQRFSDSADDSILDAILGEQYGESFDKIDAARARGQLSQGGFDNSVRRLGDKRTAARSTLEDLGLGVLGGYRDELTGIGKQFSDQIGNYKIGQNLDLDNFSRLLDERQGSLQSRMRGDIYRALGDTELFNTDAIMAKGGSAAGVSNNPLRNAFTNSNAFNDPTRTTGTTGVF